MAADRHSLHTDRRFLVRVDDFPAWTESMTNFVPSEDFLQFHAILSSHRIPYLLAVTPHPAVRPLDSGNRQTRELTPFESGMLRKLQSEGVTIALHGATHQTRDPRKHSEFAGLDATHFKEQIVFGHLELERLCGSPVDVIVPPFNRMTRDQLQILAARFRIVCGGPETTPLVGFRTPQRISETSNYLPSLPPFYGRAHEIEPALAGATQTVTCITLHWEWERRRRFKGLDSLCGRLKGLVLEWSPLTYASMV